MTLAGSTTAPFSRQAGTTSQPLPAWSCILLGLFPLAIAGGVIPVDPSALHASPWVLALCGLVFVLGGSMMLLGAGTRMNDLLAALICLSFAAVGLWVSLFGPSVGFAGGIPLLSREQNVAVGRWVIGGGAAVSLALTVYALRKVLRRGAA